MDLSVLTHVSDSQKCKYKIVDHSKPDIRVYMSIMIFSVMVISTSFTGVIMLAPQGTANDPEITGTNLSYTATWKLDTGDGLQLTNISLDNGSAVLSKDMGSKTFSGPENFSSGILNGTVLDENYQIIPGFIPDYNLTTGIGWTFTDKPNNSIAAYHDPAGNRGVF